MGKEVNIGNVLDIMNRRIEFLFDREHTNGHAFFTSLKKYNSKLNWATSRLSLKIQSFLFTRVFLR